MQLLEGVTIDSTYIVNYGGGVAIGQGDPDLAATFGVTRIDFAGNQQLLGRPCPLLPLFILASLSNTCKHTPPDQAAS